MSPRAACRLATKGFERVYDYVPGKVDWLARGLPTEGEKAAVRRAKDALRDDAVTCAPSDLVRSVRRRVAASPYGFALVMSGEGVLLGRRRRAALEGQPEATAESVMEAGPSTVRPDEELGGLLERLAKQDLRTAVVTTPEGRLLGVVRRS
jgi:CBS-domain-containing membrane protein